VYTVLFSNATRADALDDDDDDADRHRRVAPGRTRRVPMAMPMAMTMSASAVKTTGVGGRRAVKTAVKRTPMTSSSGRCVRATPMTIARATTTTNGTTVDLNEAPETFWGKMKAAYRIFFPPSAEETARQEAKKRLRMILVADRCAMSETSMDEMKRKIVETVGEFVDLDETQDVDVSMNTDVELGTMYAVSIPVRRVKAEYDAENDAYMVGAQFVGDGDEDFNYDDSVWEN